MVSASSRTTCGAEVASGVSGHTALPISQMGRLTFRDERDKDLFTERVLLSPFSCPLTPGGHPPPPHSPQSRARWEGGCVPWKQTLLQPYQPHLSGASLRRGPVATRRACHCVNGPPPLSQNPSRSRSFLEALSQFDPKGLGEGLGGAGRGGGRGWRRLWAGSRSVPRADRDRARCPRGRAPAPWMLCAAPSSG